MEPCLFRHGKSAVGKSIAEEIRKLQWSHVFSDMVRTLRSKKFGRQVLLQWSHVFSDMVRQQKNVPARRVDSASMEPCLFRHGKRYTPPDSYTRPDGFNGAMSFQTW